ncbi:hypothetical protein AKJ65_07580 [candidate division MSBL1 archaeon SCGC-AAA259E19]|uniref:Glycosyl hydrolase 94 supersandwich domain-containing protein n=1 Tax=candidate division MSBL1 archaeon SCGC-AAA259E19 TaxID=1698264 RepID=A0A133UE45_9EURY|nr:hypothetical protein AKJ65_07580 [candidate division MSBL1 archaeon SCGC-AAA259E19]
MTSKILVNVMNGKNVPDRDGGKSYGYYDEETGEYVITDPETPTPWINYIGGNKYGGIISNTAGGYSFYRDPRHRRITRYRYNSIPADQPGRYIYIRDMEEKEYWSPTWQPVKKPLDSSHSSPYTLWLEDFSLHPRGLVRIQIQTSI